MTIGKRKGSVAKGAGGTGTNNVNKIGGSLSKSDHYYIQQAFGLAFDPGSSANTGMDATGGTISEYVVPGPGDVYRCHVFTNSGTFVVNNISSNPAVPSDVEYVCIAGGGGAGSAHNGYGGGGGAGGYRSSVTGESTGGPSPTIESAISAQVATYTITVGAGGAGGPSIAAAGHGSTGGPSSIAAPTTPLTTITSNGGGGGTNHPGPRGTAGNPGGSGGGAAENPTSPPWAAGGTGTAGQGYDGGE